MANGQPAQPGMTWLAFSLITVVSWGVYGILLHTGQMGMASAGDAANARYKAFLFVGIAYFLTAVLAPLVVLKANGASWTMPSGGMTWSLIAGIAGAIGAFAVLLAFGAKGSPAVVMAIVFAGAPVVNSVVALTLHPPKGGYGSIPMPFYLGILLAATGGYLVTRFRPADTPAPAPVKQAVAHSVTTDHAAAEQPKAQ